MAGSVASLGGLNVEGALGATEADAGIAGNGDVGNVFSEAGRLVACAAGVPRLSAPRTNFCRGNCGAAGGFTFDVFSLTDDTGGGLRLVLI